MSKRKTNPTPKPAAAPLPTGRWRTIVFFVSAVAIIGGAAWLVYGRALRSPFIFDDPFSTTENPSILQLWPLVGDASSPGPLNPPKDLPTSGRPLVNLSLALNHSLGGFAPIGYHVFNLLVHVLSALLLMAIVRRALRLEFFAGRFDDSANWLALGAALLWALHPLQTETVIYVTQRTELMVGFFYLATLYGSLRYWAAKSSSGRILWLICTTLTCLAGMACKEVMVTAPVVVLLFERTFIANTFRQALRRSWPLYLGLALGWIVLLLLSLGAPRSESAGFHLEVSATDWWLTQCKVLWMYLQLAVWPWPLAIHYKVPYLTTFGAAWPWLLPTALLCIATLVLLWRRNAIGFIAAWVLLILSPTLIVPIITEVAAERRMYLPLAAIVTLAIVGGCWCLQKIGGRAARPSEPRFPPGWPAAATICAAMFLAVVASFVSIRRLAAYESPVTLWQDLVRLHPDDPAAHNNLAAALNDLGRSEDAIQQSQTALELRPDYPEAHNNLGQALMTAGRLQEAIDHCEAVLRIEPRNAAAHVNLGNALVDLNRPAEAIEHYELALQIKPGYAEAYNNMGHAFAKAGRLREAIEKYQEALRLKPEYPQAQYNLGSALLDVGQPQEAIVYFRRALTLKPDDAEYHNNFGNALLSVGQTAQAVDEYQRSLALNPQFAMAQDNLGVALMRLARPAEALEHFAEAVRLNPDFAEAQSNFALALLNAGNAQEAIEHYLQAQRLKPDYTPAFIGLAMAYAKMQKPAEAIAGAEKALEVARLHGESGLATQMQSWLDNYRANLPKNSGSNTNRPAESKAP